MERNQFKAFQPVLVRNSENAHWKTAHYSNYNEQRQQHFCDNQPWKHVLPYNELTADLIGTTRNYEDCKIPNQQRIYVIICNNLVDNTSGISGIYTNDSDAFAAYKKRINSNENEDFYYNVEEWIIPDQSSHDVTKSFFKWAKQL